MAMDRRSEAPSQADVVVLKDSLRMMSELSSGEQQAVTLLGLYDLSYEEAANLSGLPVGTMKSRLSRGRQRLRALLDPAEAGRNPELPVA
jgi:RNA polymerase sigma-70 factor (ECF subfamily)